MDHIDPDDPEHPTQERSNGVVSSLAATSPPNDTQSLEDTRKIHLQSSTSKGFRKLDAEDSEVSNEHCELDKLDHNGDLQSKPQTVTTRAKFCQLALNTNCLGLSFIMDEKSSSSSINVSARKFKSKTGSSKHAKNLKRKHKNKHKHKHKQKGKSPCSKRKPQRGKHKQKDTKTLVSWVITGILCLLIATPIDWQSAYEMWMQASEVFAVERGSPESMSLFLMLLLFASNR